MYTKEIIAAHPDVRGSVDQALIAAIDEMYACAQASTLATRRTGSDEEVVRKMLNACITACRVYGEECQRHASHHEHCRICADACRTCEAACQQALRSVEEVSH